VLVIPRLVALVLALPLLVFVGDIAGIGGGMLVGAWQLDIAPRCSPIACMACWKCGTSSSGWVGPGVRRLHRAESPVAWA
jgi:hypothetical protein